jgi:hypothetical protein
MLMLLFFLLYYFFDGFHRFFYSVHLVNMQNVGWGTTVLGVNPFIRCYQSALINYIIVMFFSY